MSKQQRQRRPSRRRMMRGFATQSLLGLLLLAVLLPLSQLALAQGRVVGASANHQEPFIAQETHDAVGHDSMLTPEQAYQRALKLLRSTLVHQPAKNVRASSEAGSNSQQSQSSRARGKGARRSSSGERWPAKPVSGAALYWELVRAWMPFAGIWRDFRRLGNAIVELNPFPLGQQANVDRPGAYERGASLISRFGPSLRSNSKTSWEGASLLTTPEGYGGGNDPVEEEQARKYPGARPEQLWPEWDGGDDAYFGPFLSTQRMDNLEDVLTQADGLPFLGTNASASTYRPSSLLSTASKKQKAEEQRTAADRRRAEAIALLTWAAGWLDDGAVKERQALVQSSQDLDWISHVEKQSTGEDEQLIDLFVASGNHTSASLRQPSSDALWTLAQHSLWGTHGSLPNVARAKACYERLVSLNGNASAHNMLGWIEGGAWERQGWELLAAEDVPTPASDQNRQARALLHYTSAARQGNTIAQTTLAYRHHAGIGVQESCGAALYWYEQAATDAIKRFQSGPPGGLIMPYTHMRLSDVSGGVFGPGSSAASTGMAKFRPAIQAMLHSLPAGGASDGRRLEDLLEFFVYHAQRGSPSFAWRLARIYYGGSVLGTSESAARVRRDFHKAREYLQQITTQVWPTDAALVRRGGPSGMPPKAGQRGDDVKLKVDDMLAAQAGLAAGLMGNMYLRGEGVRKDYTRAWVWFSRGVEQGDPESYNGFGVMHQLGLGIQRDIKKATEFFEASASMGAMASAEGSINLGKIYLAMNDFTHAVKYFDQAMKVGSHLEAYYYLAHINVRLANFSKSGDSYRVGPPGTASHERCKNAVSGFKHVVERADWKDPTFSRAERAWSKGMRGRALLGWAVSGERGYEAAQNNIAWVLDRNKKRLKIDRLDASQSNATDRLALIHWIRSAAQDNVDALVKMGDYYYLGLGLGEQGSSAHWNPKPSTTSSAPPPAPTASYDKAAACYSAAAERQTSALAYWNMGFMYERGLGVPKKDYNLAKRFYDMALDLNESEAYLPVFLSIAKLFIMAMWDAIKNQDASALSLLNGAAFGSAGRARVLNAMGGGYFEGNDLPYTEADEIRIQQERDEQAAIHAVLHQGGNGGQAGHDANLAHDADIGDYNLPETYEGIGGAQQQGGGGAATGIRRGRPARFDDEADAAGVEGGATGTEDMDDTIEGLMIVVGLAALAMLVYARQGVQNRVERHRREAAEQQQQQPQGAQGQARDDQPQDAAANAAAPPAEAQAQQQPFGWPLQDANALAGL